MDRREKYKQHGALLACGRLLSFSAWSSLAMYITLAERFQKETKKKERKTPLLEYTIELSLSM